jgi:hypothetical protein
MIPQHEIQAAEQTCRELDSLPIPTAENPLAPLMAQVNGIAAEREKVVHDSLVDAMRAAFNDGFKFGIREGLREATRFIRAGGTSAECAINERLRQMEQQ